MDVPVRKCFALFGLLKRLFYLTVKLSTVVAARELSKALVRIRTCNRLPRTFVCLSRSIHFAYSLRSQLPLSEFYVARVMELEKLALWPAAVLVRLQWRLVFPPTNASCLCVFECTETDDVYLNWNGRSKGREGFLCSSER